MAVAEITTVKALVSHPLRLDILKRLADARELSPKQLAELTDAPLGNVSYHVRELLAAGALRLVREVPVRGTLQHFYAIDKRGLSRALRDLDERVSELWDAAGLGASDA